MFQRGEVYQYSYLWAREADTGEESGRKDRPTCLLIKPARLPDILYVFPITSQPPAPNRFYEEFPANECARCGLRQPAWIILDEYNVAIASERHDFRSLTPIGQLSPDFVAKAVRKAIQASEMRAARRVVRS